MGRPLPFGRIISLTTAIGSRRGIMKAVFIPLVAIALGAGCMSVAQDMVEYSHVATKPPVSMQNLANKTNAALEKSVGSSSASKAAPKDTKVVAGKELDGKPTPPAIFILSNGTRLESSHYTLTAQNLVIQEGTVERTIPLTALDRNATVAENKKRGLDLKIPTSQSQMTLSF
jgi:hypothetical protein